MDALVGLPWVRLDTSLRSNPKVLFLVSAKKFQAAFGYVCGLTYAGEHGTDGFIPEAALPFLHMTKKEAAQLVEVNFWIVAPGGWDINGWAEFQVSNAETQERKKRSRDAAMARWHPDT